MEQLRKNFGSCLQQESKKISQGELLHQDFFICGDDSDISSEVSSCDFFIEIENQTNAKLLEEDNKESDIFVNEQLVSVSSENMSKSVEQFEEEEDKQIEMKKEIERKEIQKQKKSEKVEKKVKKKNKLENKNKAGNDYLSVLLKSGSKDSLPVIKQKNMQKAYNPINFRRSHALQDCLNQKCKQFKLMLFLVKKAPYIISTLKSKEQEAISLPNFFKNYQEYEEKFKSLYEMEVIYRVLQKINQIELCPMESHSIRVKIKTQQPRNDQIFQCEASLVLPEQTNKPRLNIKEISSKYKIALAMKGMQIESGLVVGVVENLKNCMKKDSFCILSSQSLRRHEGDEITLFSIDKYSTEMRDYEAVINMKYSEIYTEILAPINQTPSLSTHPYPQINFLLQALERQFNLSQFQAIRAIGLTQEGIHLIQGPPGSGKTSVLLGILSCEFAKLSYFNKLNSNLFPKVLVCAPSNSAADLLTLRIIKEGLYCSQYGRKKPRILRVGVVENDDVSSVSLPHLTRQWLQVQKIRGYISWRQLGRKISECEDLIKELEEQYSQNYYQVEYCKWKEGIYKAIFNKMKDHQTIPIQQIVSKIQKSFLYGTSIIISTLASSFNEKITSSNLNFSSVIIDQAGQATQPNTLVPLQYGSKKLILIGDPNQLPPTTFHPLSMKNKLNRSMFQRFIDCGIEPHFLSVQYRMTPLIRQFPSLYFYNDRLQDSEECKRRQISRQKFLKCKEVIFVGCQDSHEGKMGKSFFNSQEAKIVGEILEKLISTELSIGVISPYQSQCEMMKRVLKSKGNEKAITVNTVDSYQGQQRDVIIISTVRANNQQNLGFITDKKRINVALTRAKNMLFVVGHPSTLSHSDMWRKYINWVKAQATYIQLNTKNNKNFINQIFQI